MKFEFPAISLGSHKKAARQGSSQHEPVAALALKAELSPVVCLPDQQQEIPPLDQQIEVFVLQDALQRSAATLLDTLGIQYTTHKIEQQAWPLDHPELAVDRTAHQAVRQYALQQYCRFKAHQEILRQADPEKQTLILEGEITLAADTTAYEAMQHINAAPRFLTTEMRRYDAVLFTGCEYAPFQHPIVRYTREYAELAPVRQLGLQQGVWLQPVFDGCERYREKILRWQAGCAMYMIDQPGRAKWLAAGHGDGLSTDLFLVNELNSLVMRNTIFNAAVGTIPVFAKLQGS